MKKTVLLVLVSFVLFCTANAQEGGFKQAAGDKALEVNFAPLGGTPVGISGIQFKSYSSETSAFRMNIFIGKFSTKDTLQTAVDTFSTASDNLLALYERNSTLEIGIRPGIEKHFAGTDRLSPYIGAELDFAKKFSTKKVDNQYNGKLGDESGSILVTKTTGEKGYMRIGVNAVAGFDYFFAKKLYIGAEFGFGLSMTSDSKIKVDDKYKEQLYSDADKTYPGILDIKRGSSTDIGPNTSGKLRIGWLF